MRTAAYGFFLVSVGSWVLLTILGLYVQPFAGALISMTLAPAILVGALLVILYVAIRPRWAKTREAFVVLGLGAALLAADAPLHTMGISLFWGARETDANAFVAELLSYDRIREMDTGDRFFKELNGELVAFSPTQVDTQPVDGLRPTVPVQRVLKRDGIDPRVYEAFRQRLRRLGFYNVYVSDDYVAFVRDGILDNLYGFVWIRPARSQPTVGAEFVEETQLVVLRPIHGRWYFFATT